MFWTILLIAIPVLVLVLGLVMAYRSRNVRRYADGKTTVGEAFGMAAITSVVLVFVGFMGSAIVGEDRVPFERHLPLKSIQDNSEIHGSFFLASGGFGEDMKYYYYVERNGAYRLENIEPSAAVGVKEGDNAELVEKGYSTKGNFWAWNILGANDLVTDTIFVVPDGAIKQDYVLDAKK